jgi:hypothetical protein
VQIVWPMRSWMGIVRTCVTVTFDNHSNIFRALLPVPFRPVHRPLHRESRVSMT